MDAHPSSTTLDLLVFVALHALAGIGAAVVYLLLLRLARREH